MLTRELLKTFNVQDKNLICMYTIWKEKENSIQMERCKHWKTFALQQIRLVV